MESAIVIDTAQRAIMITAVLVAPALLVALLVGCATSVLQAVTQIQDQTISFVPKLVAVTATIVVCMPWMLEYFGDYVRQVISQIPFGLGA